jgi:hypothetical protein
MERSADRVQEETRNTDAARTVVIQDQTARTIETELSLRMESVMSAISSLEEAQRITEDRLQLQVSV